jgi:hypothetical protein
MDNEEYNPVEPKYYNYKGKTLLSYSYDGEVIKYDKIYTCCYTVNNTGKHPFLNFLLTNSFIDKTLNFPDVPIFKNFDSEELINFSKFGVFSLLMLNDFETFINEVEFNGYYEYLNNLYLFFDITKCNAQINDVYSNNNLWFTLVDEIINNKKNLNMPINQEVYNFFMNTDIFCFLCDEKNNSYEIPIVGYVKKPENKLNFTYIFGESKTDKTGILGPYYYFTDYEKIFEDNENNENKIGTVRFALFTGKTKYIENCQNDPIDDSEIKKQRLEDNSLNQKLEQLTMRISDHDGKWAENYDSAFIKNVELDNGNVFEKTIIAIKDYEQQIPLSYHFLSKKTNKELQSIL